MGIVHSVGTALVMIGGIVLMIAPFLPDSTQGSLRQVASTAGAFFLALGAFLMLRDPPATPTGTGFQRGDRT